jgi:hypothetical protein
MRKSEKIPGFAPSDITDSRKPLDWESRYPTPAWKQISIEAVYLGLCLCISPVVLMGIFCHRPQTFWSMFDFRTQTALTRYGLAWFGGALGGTLFSLKWLYHVVAHGYWNRDRLLWRFFTPHISGGLAFAVTALVASGLLRIFDAAAASRNSMVVGLSFLVGYFSDSAVAKLTEIANTLFGTSNVKSEQVPAVAQGSSASTEQNSYLPDDERVEEGQSR